MATIRVKFPHTEEIWNKVVLVAAERDDEEPIVEDEGSDFFVAEYPSEEHFYNAQRRWDGMVEHEVLN